MTMRQPAKLLQSARKHVTLFGIRGVLRRASSSVGMSSEFSVRVPGYTQRVLIRLGTTDVAAYEHVFVHDEYGFSLPNEPITIIDAGANIGMSTVYFALRYPSANIVAIEPEPTNFRMLQKNTSCFPQITVINAALWNEGGFLNIDNTRPLWGTRVSANATGTSVRAITMAQLFDDYGIQRVGLLKVDIEGAECEIFESAGAWLSHVDFVCIELHDRFRSGCSSIFNEATAGFPIRWRRGELHCVAR